MSIRRPRDFFMLYLRSHTMLSPFWRNVEWRNVDSRKKGRINMKDHTFLHELSQSYKSFKKCIRCVVLDQIRLCMYRPILISILKRYEHIKAHSYHPGLIFPISKQAKTNNNL